MKYYWFYTFSFPYATNIDNLDFAFFSDHFLLVSNCSPSKFSNDHFKMNVLNLNCLMRAAISRSQNKGEGKHTTHPGARALPRWFHHLSLSSTIEDVVVFSSARFLGCSQEKGRREVSPWLATHIQTSTNKGKVLKIYHWVTSSSVSHPLILLLCP